MYGTVQVHCSGQPQLCGGPWRCRNLACKKIVVFFRYIDTDKLFDVISEVSYDLVAV